MRPAANTDKSSRLLLARLRQISDAAGNILSAIFLTPFPADRLLADYFRAHRSCGSRDRTQISRSIYALLRYWGWCRQLLPEAKLVRIEKGERALSLEALTGLVGGALWIEGADASFAAEIFRTLELEVPAAAATPAARAAAAAAVFGVDRSFSAAELAPCWLEPLLPPDFHREDFFTALTRRPPLWLRIQKPDGEPRLAAELNKLGVNFFRHPDIADAIAIPEAKLNLHSLRSFLDGDFEVQDLGSQCIGLIAAPAPGERWLDACAGAGGKSLQLATLMQRRGVLTAGDIRASVLEELRKRARRAGFPNIQLRPHPGRFWRGGHAYDGVLIDAPCSGSGVWRRNPGSQWSFNPETIPDFARRQREILEAFAAAVKPGGVLIYATCSIFTAENEEVVQSFLDSHPDFVPEGFNHPLTGARAMGMTRIDCRDGDCDCFFAARLRRRHPVAQPGR